MSWKKSLRRLVAWLERGTKRWLFVRGATRPLGHNAHRQIRKACITENTGLNPRPKMRIVVERRLEVWRPVRRLTPEQIKDAYEFADVGGVQMALVDVDVKQYVPETGEMDLVVNAGLNAACGAVFDRSGSRPAASDYVAIGTDGTTPAAGQTALLAEAMRALATYGKDANVGECSVDATFNIITTLALQECGLFNANSGGTMYCRDTYSTKNVVSGDTVKIYYTPKFQAV